VAAVRIAIDRGVCIGAANCARLARGVFTLDDDNLAVVIDPRAADLDTLRRTEASCPSGAISIETDEP
jgi:ferredoxin